MRWIFYSLLLGNVAFFAYSYWPSLFFTPERAPISSVEVNVEQSKASVESLVLLGELAQLNSQTKKVTVQKQAIETIRLKQTVVDSEGVISVKPEVEVLSRSLCTLVGAFPSEAAANSFVQDLAAMGVASKVKNVLVSSAVGFWLHLPPLSSRKELLLRIAELQRQGIDSYVIPDGDLENGISLGMFSEEKRAVTLKNNIEQLGYQPKIAEVPREKRELWILLLPKESTKISDERWLTLLSAKELLQKQQNLCSDVASL